MGNQLPTDRRFDKPAFESMVDLLNRSNKTYIQYDEIEVVAVSRIAGSDDALFNSTVDIKLAGTDEDAPVVRMTYGRLDISEFLNEPNIFRYNGLVDADSILVQLKAMHLIELSELDCTLQFAEIDVDGLSPITIVPKPDHMVWTGELLIFGAPDGHIALSIPDTYLDGFTVAQLRINAGGP